MVFANIDALISHMAAAGVAETELKRIRDKVAKRRTLDTWDAPWADHIGCNADVADGLIPGYVVHGFNAASQTQHIDILKMTPREISELNAARA